MSLSNPLAVLLSSRSTVLSDISSLSAFLNALTLSSTSLVSRTTELDKLMEIVLGNLLELEGTLQLVGEWLVELSMLLNDGV